MKGNGNFQSVQFLRGIAAFMVVLHHALGSNYLAKTNLLRQISEHGSKGVHIFFIISGFIIPYSMYKSHYTIAGFKTFLGKRVIRIEPPYILSIVLILSLNYATTLTPWYTGLPFTMDWKNIFGHLAYLNAFTNSPWINTAYWTLAIEFEFYLVLSFLFPLIANTPVKIAGLIYLLLLTAVNFPGNGHHLTGYIPFFLFGIGLFLFTIRKLALWQFLFLTSITAIVCLQKFGISYLVLAIITMACIYYIKNVPSVFLFLGTISYSLYLIHGPIYSRFFAVFDRLAPGVNKAIIIPLCLAFILFCAYIFYRFVEKPFHIRSKKINMAKRQQTTGDTEVINPALQQVAEQNS